MKAKLLQRVTWWTNCSNTSLKKKRTEAIVIKIHKVFSHKNMRRVGNDPIEVYDVVHKDGTVEKEALSFLDIQYRDTLSIEEFLTHPYDDFRKYANLLFKHPKLTTKNEELLEIAKEFSPMLSDLILNLYTPEEGFQWNIETA